MQICKDGCGSENLDTASQCQHCGHSLRSALRLHNPGTLVRHYRIKHIIGWGGFGAVYEAEDTRQSGSRVALKESFDPNGMTSFQGEFAALQQHQHPHLPRYEAMFVDQGNGYLVMEFIPGQNLEEVSAATGGPLEEMQVVGFALQLCAVLAYLHRQNPPILHRDLKPANVRLTPNGLIKLVDFGLFKQGTDKVISTRLGLSPAYAPVEQHPLAPGHTDQRSDIYSLGATLYHLLTGVLPETAFDRIAATRDPLVPPERLNPRLSPHVAAAITKALHLAATERHQDIASFQQTLVGHDVPVVSAPQAAPARARVAAPPRRVYAGASEAPAYTRVAVPKLPVWPEMVLVPAGPFLMGSSSAYSQSRDDEKPQHTLTLPAYEIGKTEVTNAQFRPFVEGDGYTKRAYWDDAGWQWRTENQRIQPAYWNAAQWNGDNQPVVGVTLCEAVAYTRWLRAQTGQHFRLPTEAQWEKAARGTDGRIYPWGNTWDAKLANSSESNLGKTAPVGQYPNGASPYGALDMAGNVWEWTRSVYTSYPYNPTDGRENLSDPAQKRFTIRGGSWGNDSLRLRAAFRSYYSPTNVNHVVGVQLVRYP
ncbi:MAG: bifunctional serine/threonine-protein kinase/formylglycine-generating enzyme family protein [Chloroflexales bacterium]